MIRPENWRRYALCPVDQLCAHPPLICGPGLHCRKTENVSVLISKTQNVSPFLSYTSFKKNLNSRFRRPQIRLLFQSHFFQYLSLSSINKSLRMLSLLELELPASKDNEKFPTFPANAYARPLALLRVKKRQFFFFFFFSENNLILQNAQ